MLSELDHAREVSTDVLALVTADDWARPTPCEGWDVAQVVRHLVIGDHAFAVLLGGRPYDLEQIAAEVDPVPVENLAAARERSGAVFRAAYLNAFEATYPTEPLGPMTPQEIAVLRASESLVHTWDVAEAIGARDRLRAAVSRALAAGLHAASRNLMDRIPPDRSPFRPPQPAPDDAHPLDQYAAYLGRTI